MVLIDCNKWQATERTKEILKIEPMKDKWQSFGWKVYEINGHSFKSIDKVFSKFNKNPIPTAVVCRTIKGKGISYMENKPLWHGSVKMNFEQITKALKELKAEEKFIKMCIKT